MRRLAPLRRTRPRQGGGHPALHSELTEQIGRLKSQLDVATRVVTDQTTAMSGETAQAFRRLHNVRHTESQHDAAKAAADTGFRP